MRLFNLYELFHTADWWASFKSIHRGSWLGEEFHHTCRPKFMYQKLPEIGLYMSAKTLLKRH